MSNSSLVNYTLLSPNCTKPRNNTIKKITIHHMAGNLTVEECGKGFYKSSRRASSNYGVDSNGRVGLYVEEKNRAWTSGGDGTNDHQAVTIEVANDVIGGNWHVSDIALQKTIDLCVDICKRNGIKELIFTGDAKGNLTMHRYFQATECPGQYLASKFPYIADEVNKRLSKEEFNMFPDVKENDYAYNHIKKLKEYGIVNGDEKGNFNPDAPITRRDMAIMVANVLTYIGK